MRCTFCHEENAATASECRTCHSPLASGIDHRALAEEVLELLAAEQKIAAIKRYREATGAGLLEAKTAVEAIEHGQPTPAPETRSTPLDAAAEAELLRLLQEARLIDAVKLYRQRTGSGLKESRDAVLELARKNGLEVRSGCFGVLVAVVVTVSSLCGAMAAM